MRKIGFLLVFLTLISVSCKTHLSKFDKQCKHDGTYIFLFNKKIKYPFSLIVDGKQVPIINKEGKKLYVYNLTDGEHKIELLSDFYIFNRPIKHIKKGKGYLCYQVVLITKYQKDFYKDKLEKNKKSFTKKLLGVFKFWKSEKEEVNVDKTKVYAILKD